VTARPNDRIVRDGKFRTDAGVSAGIDLALAVLAEIDGEEAARVVQLTIEYDPQPSFDSGHVSKASAATRRGAEAWMMRKSLSLSELAALPRSLLGRWREVLYRRVRGERVIPVD
jgi:transcriptional regulator GlxA family with amidase domain